MQIESLPKAEMLSHLGELVSTQDDKIATLRAEKKALWVLLAMTLIITFLN